MRQFTKGIDLYKAQVERFEAQKLTMRSGHELLATEGLEDSKSLTAGQPSGKARLAMLRQEGHPFGRGAGASASTTFGRRRGGKGSMPLLPIGEISGRLHNALVKRKTAGVGSQNFGLFAPVPYAKYILGDSGTRKMVGRGFQAEIRRRWRPRNKAFIDTFRKLQ